MLCSIGPHNQPNLQDIVTSVATAKLMSAHDKLKTLTFPWHSYVLIMKLDTHGLNLLRFFPQK
jgi:hypothetical protein